MAFATLQTSPRRALLAAETWLEDERDQIALWLPVALGLGIGLWFALPTIQDWTSVIFGGLGLALAGFALRRDRRIGRLLMVGGLAVALGCGLAWWRSERMAAPRLERPSVAVFAATITNIETQAAKENFRLTLRPDPDAALPPLLRVTVENDKMLVGLVDGDHIRLRARLMPPPGAAVPGGYDFARNAWFKGLGGVGSALDPVARIGPPAALNSGLRERLSAHVRRQIAGSEGGIAAAFASGDRGGITPDDEEAMRASGLTHLLSISGLHITAVVAAIMLLVLRLLALSPTLALRWPLPLIAAGAGALAGIGYTLLTGAEVPTIRSCIAAVLVLAGLALGREAMTLRLVATGAVVVLLLWPEALVGPSFQLSFAAITSIVALHENKWVQSLVMRRDEGLTMRLARGLFSLTLTGLVVEAALAPIALYHFHKSGLYGALANLVAIPLTTFIVMPLEALALILDVAGLGAPFWWLTGQALSFLLWIAREVAVLPGAMALIPSIPVGAFVLMLLGGLWLLLWKKRPRLLGLIPVSAGVLWSLSLPAPDLLITGDGAHMAVRDDRGQMALLRPRTGDFMRDVLSERSGTADALADLDVAKGASCGRDMCLITLSRGGRTWRIAATRSDYRLPWEAFTATCRAVDIIISDRRLPKGCTPRWIKADRDFLSRSGGLAITLKAQPLVETVRQLGDQHPWRALPILTSGRGYYPDRRAKFPAHRRNKPQPSRDAP
jgi:competence protein ComEC